MSKKKHLLHVKSKATLTDGNPSLPSKTDIEYGELAINYAKDKETISLKNDKDEIVKFASEKQIDTKLNKKVSKDTAEEISGKKTFTGGVAIKSADANNNMPFFLGIDSFADGGTVKYVQSSEANVGKSTASNSVKMGNGTSSVSRNIWFNTANQAASVSGNVEVTSNSDFQYNPATKTLKVGTGTLTPTNYSGDAATVNGHTVNKDVPSDAKFTDTTYTLGSFGITATSDEINKLDGVTATTSELNILDGVTATASEINKLDGATVSTDEINHLKGVTSNVQTQLNGKQDKLVGTETEGQNIKTLNGETLLGTGNVETVGKKTPEGGIIFNETSQAPAKDAVAFGNYNSAEGTGSFTTGYNAKFNNKVEGDFDIEVIYDGEGIKIDTFLSEYVWSKTDTTIVYTENKNSLYFSSDCYLTIGGETKLITMSHRYGLGSDNKNQYTILIPDTKFTKYPTNGVYKNVHIILENKFLKNNLTPVKGLNSVSITNNFVHGLPMNGTIENRVIKASDIIDKNTLQITNSVSNFESIFNQTITSKKIDSNMFWQKLLSHMYLISTDNKFCSRIIKAEFSNDKTSYANFTLEDNIPDLQNGFFIHCVYPVIRENTNANSLLVNNSCCLGKSSISIGRDSSNRIRYNKYTQRILDILNGSDDKEKNYTEVEYNNRGGEPDFNRNLCYFNGKIYHVDVTFGETNTIKFTPSLNLGDYTNKKLITSGIYGDQTITFGDYSYANGMESIVIGNNSYSIGDSNEIVGNNSYSIGYNLKTTNNEEFALGYSNKSTKDYTKFSLAITSGQSNDYEITQDGKQYIKGIGGYDGTNVSAEGVEDVATVINNATTLVGANGTTGLIKNGSTVTSASGYTACPIVSGVPYYKDTDTKYSLSSFGVNATSGELNKLHGATVTTAEINHLKGVTSNVQTQLNGKVSNGDSRLTDSRPASDVYDWAKAETKPKYTYSEVGAAPTTHTHSQYVNQNAYSNVKIGETTISADNATDTLNLVAGNNVTITPDSTNDKITISATDTTYTLTKSKVENVLTGNITSHTHTKVNGHTVESNVPANAKFTDTTYSLVGANGTTGLIKNGSVVTSVSGYTACPIVSGVPYYKDTDTTYSLVGANGTTGLIKNGSAVTSASGYTACPIVSGVPYYKSGTSVIVDNSLASDSTTHALSANRGKELNAKITSLETAMGQVEQILNNINMQYV